MNNRKTLLGAVVCILLVLAGAPGANGQRRRGGGGAEGFGFRFVGPAAGNRVAAVAGIPGDPSTYYAGASSGGVWKSTDGGADWRPIFDDQDVAAIGALAVAPNSPNIVWAGTGEAWAIRDIDVTGDGVYESVDAGKTWKNMGLKESGRIGRIVIDPKNADNIYVCALGRLGGPQKEKGIYHTADGGKTWVQSLFVNENTGCSGLNMDAHDPNTLIAGMWQIEMHTWGEFSGGEGSGVYITHDGGAHWRRVEGHGMPKPPVGKIDVAIAPTDPNRMYALIETDKQGSFWRSEDGGDNWRVTSWDRTLIGRAGYYIRIAVSPSDEDKILLSNSGFHVSEDGGETFKEVPWGGDNHDIWIDPTNANRFVITHDGGMVITTVGGKGFERVSLPIGQMYHVAVDDQIPYYVYGNMQDNSTMRGPSIPLGGGRGSEVGWDHGMGGCESGFTLPDPTDPNVVWASCYADEVTRWDARTRQARSVSPYLHTLDSAPNQIKYRCHWTPPLAIDPFDHNTVYYGCQVVFKTTNGGQSWTVASPDLSTQDPSRIVSSGGLIGDNLGQFYGEVVFAIAPSTVQKGLVWAGTNDGKVWYTTEGGGRWTDVTKNIGMPVWGTVTSIEPSHFHAGTAYVSVDYHLVDNRDPHIYKTTDFGKTWTSISGNLPTGPLAYVRNVSEDPNCEGLLFAGTGHALYYSLDDGGKWTQIRTGLPPAPVTWTVVQKRFHDLVVSTYGRGFYILDDITPLEQMAKEKTTPDTQLFVPRSAYRLGRYDRAILNYELKEAPKGPVRFEILGPDGKTVRRLTSMGRPGINRVVWDMHYDGPHVVELRTVPPQDPHIWEEERFKGKDERGITHWGMPVEQQGPLAAPGKYTVKMRVGDQSFEQPLEVLIDPHSAGTQQSIEATLKLQLRIKDDVTRVADMINRIEWMRKQLESLETMYAADPHQADMLKAVKGTDQKMQDVEYTLVSKDLVASDDKYYVSAYKVYFNLLWLNGEVGQGAGDVAGAGDYGPTDTSVALLAQIEQDMAHGEAGYKDLMTTVVPAFNRELASKGGIPLATTAPGPARPGGE
ncbi:MAG TPA: hypothetical protein VJU82_05870 [Acidobacteriaceae bacterium]|nr:hypothetical protein [Acidobacteriaceae bacterium]